MTGSRLTRRSALRQGGAGVLGFLAAGAQPRARGAPDPDGRTDLLLGSLGAGTSAPLQLARPADMLAVEWVGPRRGVSIELRVRLPDGSWSRWADAATLHGGEGDSATERRVGEPIWVGGARSVQLRAGQAVYGVRLHALRLTGALGVAAAAPLPLYPAGSGQPPISSRGVWADASVRPRVAPAYGQIELAFVHHTESLNGYSAAQSAAMVRSIAQFHIDVRGWDDIGYNFLVDRFGTVFEGRAGGIDQPVRGAHAGGYNGASTGVALLGSFSAGRPPAAAARALERLLAWKLALHGVPAAGRAHVRVSRAGSVYARFPAGAHVALPRVCGHRDGCSTDCPGNALYGELPSIRRAVLVLAGRQAELAIQQPTGPGVVGAPFKLSGRFSFTDGTPIAAAPIELRSRGAFGAETLLAGTQTAPDGSWAALVTLTHASSLRAVHPVLPARVSRAVEVALAPQITLAEGSPGQLNGTVSPPKPLVTVDVYAVGTGGALTRALGTLHAAVDASSGTFSVALPALSPPPSAAAVYVAAAHTVADAVNVAGSSPALTLTA